MNHFKLHLHLGFSTNTACEKDFFFSIFLFDRQFAWLQFATIRRCNKHIWLLWLIIVQNPDILTLIFSLAVNESLDMYRRPPIYKKGTAIFLLPLCIRRNPHTALMVQGLQTRLPLLLLGPEIKRRTFLHLEMEALKSTPLITEGKKYSIIQANKLLN